MLAVFFAPLREALRLLASNPRASRNNLTVVTPSDVKPYQPLKPLFPAERLSAKRRSPFVKLSGEKASHNTITLPCV